MIIRTGVPCAHAVIISPIEMNGVCPLIISFLSFPPFSGPLKTIRGHGTLVLVIGMGGPSATTASNQTCTTHYLLALTSNDI